MKIVIQKASTLACVGVVIALSFASQSLLPAGEWTVTGTDGSGAGSLSQAVSDANASGDSANTINFAIPGSGTQVITVSSALSLNNASGNAIVINGLTQTGATPESPLIKLSGDGASRILSVESNGIGLYGIHFAGGQSDNGGALRILSSSTVLSLGDVVFEKNNVIATANNGGGAIRADGNLTLTGSGNLIFSQNTSSQEAGAIFAANGLVLSGTRDLVLITSNTAAVRDGGAIEALTGNVLINGVTSGTFSISNNFGRHGGAIRVAAASGGGLEIGGSHGALIVDSNTAGVGGATNLQGGAFSVQSGDLLISATTSELLSMSNNRATGYGGVAYTAGGNFVLAGLHNNVRIDSNTAQTTMGGVVRAAGSFSITATTTGTLSISDNTAYAQGGAIYSTAGVTIGGAHNNIYIDNNRARGNNTGANRSGGAINTTGAFIYNAASTGTVSFSGNKAESMQGGPSNGGAILATGTVDITGSAGLIQFVNNTATGTGGAIFVDGPVVDITLEANGGDILFSGNKANNIPNAIAASTGTLTLGGDGNIYFDDPFRSDGTDGVLVKRNAGTVRVRGSNRWRGSTAIEGGMLLLDQDALLNTNQAGKVFTVDAGATLGLASTVIGGTAMVNAETFDIKGGLQAFGTGTLILNGTVNITRDDFVIGAALGTGGQSSLILLNGDAILTGSGTGTINITQWGVGTFDILSTTGTAFLPATEGFAITVDGIAIGTGDAARMNATGTVVGSGSTLQITTVSGASLHLKWTGTGSDWNYTSNNWTIDQADKPVATAAAAYGDSVTFGDDGTSTTVVVGGADAATINISGMAVEGSVDYTFTGGVIRVTTSSTNGAEINPSTVTGKLVKSGTSTLTFNNAGNIFENGIDLNGGSIVITSGSQLATGVAAGIAVKSSSTLAVAGSAPAGVVVDVSTGIMLENNSPLALANGGKWLRISSIISGSGALSISGDGLTTLGGANIFTGDTTLVGGTLALANAASLGAAINKLVVGQTASLQIVDSLDISNGITIDAAQSLILAVSGSKTFTYSGALTGGQGGELTISGSNATVVFAAGQTYNADTVITAGARLAAGAADVFSPNSRHQVRAGGMLDLGGFSQHLGALANDGVVRFGGAGGQVLTLGSLAAGSGTSEFQMNVDLSSGTYDSIVVTGAATGEHKLTFAMTGDVADPKTVNYQIVSVADADTDAVFTAEGFEKGMNAYGLAQTASGEWNLTRTGASSIANSILTMAGAIGTDWHYSLDGVHQRLGDLRATMSNISGPNLARTGNAWVRANAYHLDAGSELAGTGFDQDSYTITAGLDMGGRFAKGTLVSGGFISTSRSKLSFANPGEATTDGVGLGLYATWIQDKAWHADLVFKVDSLENTIDAPVPQGGMTKAEYNSLAYGFSFEFGRRITLGKIWLEPALQAAVAWLGDESYSTNDNTTVSISRAAAAQYRGQLRAGVDLGARWLPYVKIAGVKSDTSGGKVYAEGYWYDPQFDGWRFETGAGVACMIGTRGQVYFDYEYSKADYYERPWAVALGYRYIW